MNKKCLFIVLFCSLMLFGKTNNLFSQVFYQCPLINFTVNGERIRDIETTCIMSVAENFNITVYIFKQGTDHSAYEDYSFFNNIDNIYARYQFRNRVWDFEPDYSIFPEIIISGVEILGNEFRCKLNTYVATPYDRIMMFDISEVGTEDIVLSQIVLVRQERGSTLTFDIEYD